MTVSESNLRFAVKNVAGHGDTDVFPFPLENHWFHDQTDEVVDLLVNIDKNFDTRINDYPVNFVKSLSAVGYAGFRGATQIDPLWNAYFLGLIIEIGQDIESARIPSDRKIVFSYRYNPAEDSYTIFDKDLGWGGFQQTALERSSIHQFILSTDISDFYSRIYHHRLENALKQCTRNSDAVRRIKEM